jgi:ATP-dependent Clp protease ATP-binding subunit ClpA
VLDRFDDQARMVVNLAEEEARELAHTYIGTEHLLLGVLVEGSGPAASTVERAGANLPATRRKVEEAVGKGRGASTDEELPFSSRASRALERAARLSLQAPGGVVRPEHVLVGVLDVEGRAGQVLRGLGIDTTRLRAAVEAVEDRPATPAPREAPKPEARAPSGPRCPTCRTFLESSLSHRVLRSDGEGSQRRNLAVAYCGACGVTIGVFPV